MELRKVKDAEFKTAELIAHDIYYFYAEPNVRYSLDWGSILPIASFLLGAFSIGLIDFAKDKLKAASKDAAEALWHGAKARLHTDEDRRRIELARLLSDAAAVLKSGADADVKRALKHTEEALVLVLMHNNMPTDKAQGIAQAIATVFLDVYGETNQ